MFMNLQVRTLDKKKNYNVIARTIGTKLEPLDIKLKCN